MTFTQELILELVKSILPIILLVLGGQYLADRYAIRRKKKEVEIDLIHSSRGEKYKIIHEVYKLFGEYMQLYRKINSPLINLEDLVQRNELFDLIISAESRVDSMILKIGTEFVEQSDNQQDIESLLGNFRQSVQIWRESLVNGQKLPFNRSTQDDYLRFKTAFANVTAFMSSKIHEQLDKPSIKMEQVENMLVGSFDNKYEKWNLDKNLDRDKNSKYFKNQ